MYVCYMQIKSSSETIKQPTYVVMSCGGELSTTMCQRQRVFERMELESQVGAVYSHDAPVDASVRRTTLANAQDATSSNFNSSALPDDIAVFVVGTADSPAPDHLLAPEPPRDRAEDADGRVRDDCGHAAADLERDAVARRHQNELGRFTDDGRPTSPRPRLPASRAVAEVALLLRRRLRR